MTEARFNSLKDLEDYLSEMDFITLEELTDELLEPTEEEED